MGERLFRDTGMVFAAAVFDLCAQSRESLKPLPGLFLGAAAMEAYLPDLLVPPDRFRGDRIPRYTSNRSISLSSRSKLVQSCKNLHFTEGLK